MPLSGSEILLECCELLFSVGNCEIFRLRAFKSPVIADQPRARYSPKTEIVAMETPTVGPGLEQNNAHMRWKESAWASNSFDNTMLKHANPLWCLCFMQTWLAVGTTGSIWVFRCLPYPADRENIFIAPPRCWNISAAYWISKREQRGYLCRQSAKLIRNANKHIDHFDYLHCP